jgi:hypothetical protein
MKKLVYVLSLIVLASLILAACAPAATPVATEAPVVATEVPATTAPTEPPMPAWEAPEGALILLMPLPSWMALPMMPPGQMHRKLSSL